MITQQTGPLPAVSALRLNSVLTKLTLQSVDAGGIAKLAGVLSELSTLKTLELYLCRIGSGGAKHLGKYNSHCKCPGLTLETVDIKKVAADTFFLQLFSYHYYMYTMQQTLPSSPPQPSLKFASRDKLVKYGTGYKEKMVYLNAYKASEGMDGHYMRMGRPSLIWLMLVLTPVANWHSLCL